jgi:hypothetical protein
MSNRHKLDSLIKELLDNEISFTIEPSCDLFECSAGYNQRNLRMILEKNNIDYHFSFGHYWWDI